MKTAMQQLIDFVKLDLKLIGYEHSVILNKCNDLLEVEKRQIVEAKNGGFYCDKCKGITTGSALCENAYCPNMPCCNKSINECKC